MSPVLLGLVGFAGQVPVFLLAPVGGSLADCARSASDHRRHPDRHRWSLALILAGLTLGGQVQIWHVFVLATLLGVVNAFDIPARQAFLVDMVGKDDLINAIALNSSMVNGARIVGPAMAGVLVAAVGEGWCFFAQRRQLPRGDRRAARDAAGGPPEVGRARARRWRTSSRASASSRGPRRSATCCCSLGLISLMGMPYAVLMPIFADQILHGGARGLGLLMGASGLGALLGALVLASRRGVRGLGRWVAWAAAGFGVSLIAFSLSRSVLALGGTTGAGRILDDGRDGRVEHADPGDGPRPAPGPGDGGLLDDVHGHGPLRRPLGRGPGGTAGAPWTVASGGVACIAGAAVFGWRLPRLREEGIQLIVAQEALAGKPTGAEDGVGRRLSRRENRSHQDFDGSSS